MRLRDLIPWRRKTEVPVRRVSATRAATVQDRINELFDRYLSALDRVFFDGEPLFEASFWPPVTVKENEHQIVVRAELPGLDPGDLDVTLTSNSLIIAGEKREERSGGDEYYHFNECTWGSFRREIPLPEEIEADKVSAEFSKGVLTVTLPKTEEARKRSRKVQVRVA